MIIELVYIDLITKFHIEKIRSPVLKGLEGIIDFPEGKEKE